MKKSIFKIFPYGSAYCGKCSEYTNAKDCPCHCHKKALLPGLHYDIYSIPQYTKARKEKFQTRKYLINQFLKKFKRYGESNFSVTVRTGK